MKYLFAVILYGLKNPRYYIEALNVKRKPIILTFFLMTLVITLLNFFKIYPYYQAINNDLIQAKSHIPQYQYVNENLFIAEDDKALYYNSDSFQLIIDDQIVDEGNYTLRVNDQQKDMIDMRRPIGLYLFKNNGFLSINGQVHAIPSYDYLFANPHRLSLFLDYFQDSQWAIILSIFLVLFLVNSFSYLIQLVILAFLANIFNYQLTRPLSFKTRMKMVLLITLVPILIIEILSLFFPVFQNSFLLLLAITLFVLYKTFKYHTQHVHDVMETLDPEIIEEKLQEIEAEMERQRNKENDQKKSEEDKDDDHRKLE